MITYDIIDCPPSPDTEVGRWCTEPDYRDAMLVEDLIVDDIADFADRFFLGQPAWLAAVSMQLPKQSQRAEAIGKSDYVVGSSIGRWEVHGRTDDEIVFGEHMGFMEYRFSMLRRSDGRVEAGTSVRYTKRFGHIYFAVVKPSHMRFVRRALRSAATFQQHGTSVA